jgi:dihydroneopterin aldolase
VTSGDPPVDAIVIRGVRVLGRHGVLPHERTSPQPFEVDLELAVDTRAAGRSDDLADTVDYAAVIDAVRGIVEGERHALLERLADRIAETCRRDLRVRAVTVTVRKLAPPVAALVRDVGVRVRR